ncbi:transcriptional regulator with XRE-family HTH domain [Mycobacterium sp. OAS707]|uniref:helix-turn-helix domain-containing protein n=1 Tax=Mycobacterium sp. OAS707 TaxID=2663822 RepID=UPI0017896132|nr:transcriptional regulator with XRE-family HTH domain [Mycobacterium sp. OAS707]
MTSRGPVPTSELRWIPEAIANLMLRRNITSRDQLAGVIGVSRSRVYDMFEGGWSGRASTSVLAQIAGAFGVPLGSLATKPALQHRPARAQRSVAT